MTRLVARDDEVRRLSLALDPSNEGSGLVVVTGLHGVGKSAVVDHVLDSHTRTVMRVQAVPWESRVEFGVLRQVDPERMPGAVVVLENAQWADVESLQALASAVRQGAASAPRVVLVRTDDAKGVLVEVDDFFEAVSRDAIVVERLGSLGVAQLMADYGVNVSPMVAERIALHTSGLARHIVDLMVEAPSATWASTAHHFPAPRSVARRTLESLSGMSPEAKILVETVAVLDPQAMFGDVATMAQIEDPLVAYEEAQNADLVRGVDVRGALSLTVRDPMVREAVLEAMGPVRRADAHRHAAGLLADTMCVLRHRVAATVVPDAALADELDAVGSERAADGAWAEVAELLTMSSRLTQEPHAREDRLLRAMDALIGAGDVLAATSLVPEVESFRETPLRNAVLGYLAVVRGRSAEAELRLSRAWDIVNVDREPDVAALICQRHVLHCLAQCRASDLVMWADRAMALVPPDSPAAIESRAIRGLGVGGSGHTAEALQAYRDLAEETQHGAQAQRIIMGSGWLFLAVDEVEQARAALESALPTDFLGGSTRISLWAHGWLARALFVAGEWDDALDLVARGTEVAARSGMTFMDPLLHWTSTQIHSLRGEWMLAEISVRRGDAGALDYSIMRVPAALARAQHAEAQADYQGVLRNLGPLANSDMGESVDEPGFWPWADIYANALVVEGRLDEADAFLRVHEARALDRMHGSTMARLGYARGRLHGARGDLDAARQSFTTSLELLDGLPLRYDRGRVTFAYGQTLRRAGKRREADTVMSSAREIFLSLGATTYVERCDRELRAGGVRVRQDRESTELTPQETLVADLVARGLSNREVATQLFISAKTVQYHLTRTYAKLGIRSRSELAATWVRGDSTEDPVRR